MRKTQNKKTKMWMAKMWKWGIAGALALQALTVPAMADSATKLIVGEVEAFRRLSEFAKPTPAPARLKYGVGDLAGHAIEWEDQFSKGTVTLNADGSFAYTDATHGAKGMWWIDPKGALCLTSERFWWGGQCWELHGSKSSGLQFMHQKREFDAWFPARFTK